MAIERDELMVESQSTSRRWSQFTIQSCLLLTALAGVLVAWWIDHAKLAQELQESQQSAEAEIADLEDGYQSLYTRYEAEKSNTDLVYEERRLFSMPDLKHSKDRELFEAVKSMELFPLTFAEHQNIQIGDREFEVVLFYKLGMVIPGEDCTLALIRDRSVLDSSGIVDVLWRSSNIKEEHHDSVLSDADNDGRLDVVISTWSAGAPESTATSEVYRITEQGFAKQD